MLTIEEIKEKIKKAESIIVVSAAYDDSFRVSFIISKKKALRELTKKPELFQRAVDLSMINFH